MIFYQAEDGIRYLTVTGVQTCALPIFGRRGADVIHEGIKHVHVSGHGSEEELKLMLSLVRPRFFIPIHGEYRQLSQHARVAARVFAGRNPRPEILLAENGDLLAFDDAGGRVAGKTTVGRVLIDGTRTGEV